MSSVYIHWAWDRLPFFVKLLTSPHLHAGLWIVTISALMLMPADALPEIRSLLPASLEQWIDKVEHFAAFLFMTVLLARSMDRLEGMARPVPRAAGWTLAIAFFLEALQAPIPWRYFDPLDLVADGLGVLCGWPLSTWVVRHESRSAGRI